MRFHFTSVVRAKKLARDLRRLAAGHGTDINLNRSRDVLARMLGYRDWPEFVNATGRHDRPPSSFDELLDPPVLRRRLWNQSVVLGGALGIEPGKAAVIVADLRATAHPAGPHRLTGPSSLPLPWPVAYRGWTPSGNILEGFRLDRSKPWHPNQPFDAAPPGGGAPDLAAQLILDRLDFNYGPGMALTGEGRVEWVDADERLGDAWKVRATALIQSVMLALAWKRDHEGLDLTWDVVRAHLGIASIARMTERETLPPLIRFLLSDYLQMLPGYETGCPPKRTTADQHGFLQMQMARATGKVESLHGNFLLGPDVDIGTAGSWMTATITLPPEIGGRPPEDVTTPKSVFANLTTKIFMRVEELDQTETLKIDRS